MTSYAVSYTHLVLGVYVHSRSADILNDTKAWGYTPSDVSTSLGCVISELLGE